MGGKSQLGKEGIRGRRKVRWSVEGVNESMGGRRETGGGGGGGRWRRKRSREQELV